MGFLDIFKSSSKAVDTASDLALMGAKGVDMIFYTDEEKALDAGKSAELKYKWAELALEKAKLAVNESTNQTISRRIMAWAIIGNGIAMTWLFFIASAWEFKPVIDACKTMFQFWEYAVLAVVISYFTAHGIRIFKAK